MWFKLFPQQVEIRVFVKPNAKRTAVVGVVENELHIALHAKPHEGEANKALIIYLAKLLDVPKSQITLRQGDKSRHKVLIMPLNQTVQQFLTDLTSLN